MNMMKYCPECYKELPPNSDSCPFCGYKPEPDSSSEQAPPKILKTPKTSSYIPPEQTTLSLLLLLIFFWGINLALTVVPIFFDVGTIRNLLIAGISSQVLTRILIGFWALEEISLKKGQTTNKKIGSFLLTFVPIGAMFSFLAAAKTLIRRERLANLTTAAIASTVIMALMLYTTADGFSALTSGSESPLLPSGGTLNPTQQAVATTIANSVSSPQNSVSFPQDCLDPESVTVDEVGDILAVCGEVTNYGDIECDSCPLGFYSFIKLNGAFQIVSYDWRFSFAWLGQCLRVSDEVELLGEKPVFVFGKGEGYAGTECITDAQGELVCEGGIYFQDYICSP